MRKIKIILLMSLLSLCLSSFANYEFCISLKDGKLLNDFTTQNLWMKEFSGSPLFRGLFFRLSPLMNFVDKDEVNWKGKFANFVASQLIDGRTIDLYYFKEKGLASPLGLRVRDLGPVQLEVVKKLVNVFNTKTLIGTTVLHAVNILNNKFAITFQNGDLIIARTPKVVANIVEQEKHMIVDDLEVRVSIFNLAPSIAPFFKKFYGISDLVTVAFGWDKKKYSFVPAESTIDLADNRLLKDHSVIIEQYPYLPANAPFSFSLFTPVPEQWNKNSLITFLELSPESLVKVGHKTVSFVHFGKEKGSYPNGIVLPFDSIDEKALENVDSLFDSTVAGEASFEPICQNMVSVSNLAGALSRFKATCEKKEPSVANLSSEAIDFYTQRPLVAFGKIDLGLYLKQIFVSMWDKSEDLNEFKSTTKLLDGIPIYLFRVALFEKKLKLMGKYQ